MGTHTFFSPSLFIWPIALFIWIINLLANIFCPIKSEDPKVLFLNLKYGNPYYFRLKQGSQERFLLIFLPQDLTK